MKPLLFLLLFITSLASCGQPGTVSHAIAADIRNPFTPAQDSLRLLCGDNPLPLVKERKNDTTPYDLYYLDQKLFEGWAYEVFPDNHHRYRYSRYESGQRVRQITYFASGLLASDFHQEYGEPGSARMWHRDGTPYINTYHNKNHDPDGLQWRWFKNGAVARKALFDNGKLIYELLYNMDGSLSSQKGKVPEDQ